MKVLTSIARACLLSLSLPGIFLGAQAPAPVTLSGTVYDPSGALITKAAVHLHSDAADQEKATDGRGSFSLTVEPGTYSLTVEATGFQAYTQPQLVIAPTHNRPLKIVLTIATTAEQIEVPSESGMSTDPDANKSALILKGDQLNALAEDPALMQMQLQVLAGSDPSTPGQLFVDGFSNGTMPPKQSIREIRINDNSFASQNDRFGRGRIEVFTKPGSNKLHGSVDFNYGNSTLNARNPYTGPQPPYSNDYTVASLEGPLGKKTSFFANAQRSDLSQNEVVNAVTLDANLNPVTVSEPVPNEAVGQTYDVRLDRQFGAADTFTGHYIFSYATLPNAGVGLLVLPSEAYASKTRTQTVDLSDAHLFGPNVILNAALQYIRTRSRQDPVSTTPALIVEGSFSSGGNPAQSLHDNQDRIELQQYLTISHGKHLISTGVRYRLLRDANLATLGYNGQFVFPDLATYRNTLLDIQGGLSPSAILAKGDGASQFSLTTGSPNASLINGDVGVYAEDQWKARPNLTFTYGLRIESESAIPDHFDLGPRVGFALALKPKRAKEPQLVLRGGFGIFYERFAAADILKSLRENGISQQVYFVQDPTFYPAIPAPATLSAVPSSVYSIDPHLRLPLQMQGEIAAEHTFGKFGDLAVSYYPRLSVRQFVSQNRNAPLPGTYNTSDPSSGTRPFGGTQNLYQYTSAGINEGEDVNINGTLNLAKRVNVWAFLSLGHEVTDTSGADTFPANSYNVRADLGPWIGFTPRSFFSGVNAQPGWGTSLNLFMGARSHGYFNITTGQDNNGDSIYNDRPAFATDLSRPSVLQTAYGNFDTDPLPSQKMVPFNYAHAPGFLEIDLYAHKDIHFGPRPASVAPPATAAGKKAPPEPPRYRMQFGIQVDNLLNSVNPGTPVGVLTSPFFGKSISLNTPFTNNTAANRALTLRSAFYF